jgi:hypothetical protein
LGRGIISQRSGRHYGVSARHLDVSEWKWRLRAGEPLKIGREVVSYGRNVLTTTKPGASELQHRFFVNDPWELIAEAIARAVKPGRTRDVAQSFRRQAEDYFRAATTGRELAVKPVLLYYAFLNLSKAHAIAKGNTSLAGRASHGMRCDPNPKTVPGTLINFEEVRKRPRVFQELLTLLDGNPAALSPSGLRLGYLLPQVLTGHRLWCYATNRAERFSTIETVQLLHSAATKQVWINLYLNKDDLERLNISNARVLSQADLREFEVATGAYLPNELVCFQQRNPDFNSQNDTPLPHCHSQRGFVLMGVAVVRTDIVIVRPTPVFSAGNHHQPKKLRVLAHRPGVLAGLPRIGFMDGGDRTSQVPWGPRGSDSPGATRPSICLVTLKGGPLP